LSSAFPGYVLGNFITSVIAGRRLDKS